MPGLLDIFESILNQAGQAHDKSRSTGGQRSSRRRTNFPQLDPLPEPGRGGVGDVMKSVVQIVALRQGFMGGMTSCLLYTSPSPRDQRGSRMPSSA